MAFKYREEIVGKRFLSVSGFTKLKPGKISEWGWRAGVIRAASHKDNTHPELQVLVEYDDVEWHRREWISLFKDNLFHLFMVEQGLAWVERNNDPFDPTNARVLWPAFTFTPLVSTVELTDEKPVEFLLDRELAFEDYEQLEPFQDWNRPGVREYPELKIAVRRWAEQQDGQRILLTTPSVLVGYRVEVYRAEGTTQWYTAVIVGYNEATRDLTVTDDTVLEEHNEDPALVQMRLIGDGVVESIMRGEEVGITPRRSRSAAVLQTIHHPSRGVRGLSLGSRKRAGKQSTSPEPSDKGTTKTRKRKTSEDLENKQHQGRNKKTSVVTVCSRKKKLLEEGGANNNNEGLREVEIRVEDCLQSIHRHLRATVVNSPLTLKSDVENSNDSSCALQSVHEELELEEEEEGVCDAIVDSMPVVVSRSSVALSEEDSDCVLVSSPLHHLHHHRQYPTNTNHRLSHSSRGEEEARSPHHRVNGDDDALSSATSPFNRMELADPIHSISNASLLRFPDDRSDSGVSSLRSSSGDERSGSRSSALSSSDEPTPQQSTTAVLVTSTSIPSTASTSTRYPASLPPSTAAAVPPSAVPSTSSTEPSPVRVWRDPNLLLESEPHVRHIHSVQHQTLLMSHPSTPAAQGPPSSAAPAHPASLYPPVLPPPPSLITPHPLQHHPHLAPPAALYPHTLPLNDILWKHQRFAGIPVNSSHLLAQQASGHPEDMMDRERAATVALLHDRDRHERIMRERQQQEVEKHKEMERLERERQERDKLEREREREREKQERERERELLEKERQEQALHNHFEKSLRQAAQQKREQWNPIGQKQPHVQQPQQMQQRLQEEERKRAEEMHQRVSEQSRHMGSVRQQERDLRTCFYTTTQRPSSVPGKGEYPPPPAHSRITPQKTPDKTLSAMNSAQQKSEVNMFGYPVLQPFFNTSHGDSLKPKTDHHSVSKASLVVTKGSLVDNREVQLKNEVKNSVIVKHDGKNAHHLEQSPRVSVAYSPTPKVGISSLYLSSPANQGPKSGALYEYRSPTQSPQQMQHRGMENQSMGSKSHHRQLPSPHHHQRQSPHHPNPPPNELHYRGQESQSALMYPSTKPQYPYMSTTVAYSMPNTTTTANSKPKVSSPAPHHFYGKPSSGIPAKPPLSSSVSPSPYQQASQYHPPHPQVTSQITCPPPPAHSRTDSRIYSSPNQTKLSPPTSRYGAAPPSVQTQPLDLGVSSSVSPKRKAPPVSANPVSLEVKKRRVDAIPPPHSMYVGQPQLARVSEPSPLIASAATTITTVVNTAAYRTPLATSSSSPVNLADAERPSSVERTQHVASPVTNQPLAIVPTEETRSETPVKLTVSCVDSEKSNSPNPAKTSYQGHKHLKKQWLQSYTGEDSCVDSAAVTGTGSCVTVVNMSASGSAGGAAMNKEPIHSIHSVGSMAVNSINKSKHFAAKTNNRKTPIKETLNGHPGADAKGDDSSSSDQDRGRKSPPKRKPPKVKRKKGGGPTPKTKAGDEKKRPKPGAVQSAPPSESGSDSEKESGSEKDSDSGASTTTQQSTVAKKGTSSLKEPRKRGRRPKSSKNDKGGDDSSRPLKKSKEESAANNGTSVLSTTAAPPTPPTSTAGTTTTTVLPRDPFRKPPVSQLKKTGESFLQDGPCFEVAPKLAKCRECRWTPNQRSKNMPNIFCRFYAFRRLRYTKNGQLAIAGFSDPHKDASEDDLKLWLPNAENPPSDLDLETSRFILKQVGDHFCDLFLQEKDAHAEYVSDDKTVAWKRVVQGVREMCDVCETTLFNFHYACGKCGFVVCLDCYKSRRSGSIKVWGEPGKDRDEFSWLLCTNRQGHEQDKLMLTQIIAGDSLPELSRMVHEMRDLWNIEQFCACPASKEIKTTNNNHVYREIVKRILSENKVNGIKKEVKEECDTGKANGIALKDEKTSPLSWLADVALSNEDNNKCKEENNSSSDSDEGSFSTLRELLIRPSHKPNGSRAGSPVPQKNAKRLKLDTLDEVISSVIEDSVPKNNENVVDVKTELKHFLRRYNWQAKGRAPLPIRIMTLTESKLLYPDVPHSWLCDGKLLRLSDCTHKDNTKIFQDQWKRGQPVIVSDVTRNLSKDLWAPDSFARDFGDEKNDLINCMTGNLVPNQPMRKFWEGFDHFSKRLKDERGNPMLLKLKDWPPGEDFAEMLPTRFADLMKVLPLSEYTHRTGRLNLASRLPDCFVRPDLGPKMYNAYGSALHPSKGTTNLHLDISDAVNVMVYVGIPKDGDSEEHIKEAFRAIDEAGCDILTRRRVRDKGELPGALWHIYNARDADKIRDLLNKVVVEKGGRLEPLHDPIHDQSCYLDGPLRERLYKEYGVEGYAIVQCLGDAVFIPAGAPHQVRNLHNCIKVAEDFVSPENVSHCFHLTQEFRDLSDTHTNHEDKLQIKNIIFHAIKDALSCIGSVLQRHATGGRKKEENGGNGDATNTTTESQAA